MDDIDLRAWKDTYKRDWILRAQQKQSRLLQLCERLPDSTEERYFYFDTMGNTTPVPKQSYGENTPDISVGSERRRGSWLTYHWGKLYDDEQLSKLIADPKPRHQQNAIFGFHRTLDDIIISAVSANVIVLDTTDAGISTALPSTQVITEAGTNGLTIAKLHQLRELFDGAEVDETMLDANGQIMEGQANRGLVVSTRQITDLLGDTKVTSTDFNTVRALAAGAIQGFMGFHFIRSGRLSRTGNMRKILAVCKGGIGVPPIGEPSVSLDKRPDKSNAMQLYLKARYGATRIEDVRVATMECYEAP